MQRSIGHRHRLCGFGVLSPLRVGPFFLFSRRGFLVNKTNKGALVFPGFLGGSS